MSEDLKDRVENLLKSLGDTPEAVADSLREHGITGGRKDGCLCPISNLIRAEFPEAQRESDWGDGEAWFVDNERVSTPDGRVDTPAAVNRFIWLFDDGEDDVVEGGHDFPFADLDDGTGDL